MKSILILLLCLSVYGQANAPVVTPEQQSEFAQAQKMVGDAAIAQELARRQMETAQATREKVIYKIRLRLNLSEEQWDAQLDKDGKLTFVAKAASPKP